MPKITVGILTHDRKDAVLEAIESALDQDAAAEIEVLVVDSNSRDGTWQSVRRQFPQVKIIRLPRNLGCPGGRNHIYANATGDYIVNLDDDGSLGHGALRRVQDAFDSDPSIGILAMRRCAPGEDIGKDNGAVRLESGSFSGGVSAFRRTMLEEIGDYPDDFFLLGEEAHLVIRAMSAGYKVVYDPGIIVWHPRPEDSDTHSRRWDYLSYRNALLVVIRLFPVGLMLKYLTLRLGSYALRSLLRRTFGQYLKAVASVFWQLPGTLLTRKPCKAEAVRKYFRLRSAAVADEQSKRTCDDRHRVAVVQACLTHYREPLVRALCQQAAPDPQYTWLSDPRSQCATLETIDPARKDLPLEEGGLRWRFVRSHWFGKLALWQTGLIRLALSKDYDTIVYPGAVNHLSTWVSAPLARLTGKRVLMWTHGFRREERNLKGWIRAAFYRMAQGMLLYGNRARKIMISKGFDPARLYVVYNSLDYDAQCRIRRTIGEQECRRTKEKLFPRPDLPVLCCVGRMIADKKLDMLLQAARILNDRGTGANVLLVGDGPQRKPLQNLAAKLELTDRVKFYGPCYDERQLARLISMCDLCVSPEGVGLTALHALVYGTPVITHDDPRHQKPEYEAIAAGANGAFYRRGSVQDLAATIESWLDDPRPPRQIRDECERVIDEYYNPRIQVEMFNAAVRGIPADKVLTAAADPAAKARLETRHSSLAAQEGGQTCRVPVLGSDGR